MLVLLCCTHKQMHRPAVSTRLKYLSMVICQGSEAFLPLQIKLISSQDRSAPLIFAASSSINIHHNYHPKLPNWYNTGFFLFFFVKNFTPTHFTKSATKCCLLWMQSISESSGGCALLFDQKSCGTLLCYTVGGRIVWDESGRLKKKVKNGEKSAKEWGINDGAVERE